MGEGANEDEIPTLVPGRGGGDGRTGQAAVSGEALTLPERAGQTAPGFADTLISGSELEADPRTFEPGDRIGTFVFERKLGEGAMGVVVLAHDPELDRPVAIKVLRTDYAGPTAMARLTREAQSAAKISHPNVVAIHQVGTHDGQVYVVMEYVDGGTLRDWAQERRRSWREIVDVYRQAGRGLAAAHELDLVHRDFKPDNVLIGVHGRVRVTDFGLVGIAGEPSLPGQTLEASAETSLRLTRTGSIMGTPAYMSPEQHGGKPVDARSDQFSFCVALYEALYRQRPFKGGALAELAIAVVKGQVVMPPASDVPRKIQDAIMQGLLPRPDDRHHDMDSLLTALAPARKRALNAATLTAGGVVLLGLTAGAFALGSKQLSPRVVAADCPDPAEAFGAAWDEGRRSEVAAAFEKTGHRMSEDVFRRLDEELSAHAERWANAWSRACDAQASGEQTEGIYALRRQCLESVRDEAEVFSGLLAGDDDRLVDGALSSATLLRPIGACEDVEALQAVAKPTPQQLEALAPLRKELTRARILLLAGRHHDVLTLARELEPKLREIDFASDLAANLLILARGEMQLGEEEGAERHLREAIKLAAQARANAVEARATATLMFVVGNGLDRPDEALGMVSAGEAAALRSSDPRAQAYLSAATGTVMFGAGRHDEAMNAFNAAIVVLEGLDRPPPDELGMAYSNRAGLELATGDKEQAFADFERGLDIIGAGLGKRHPFYGALSLSLGLTLSQTGRYDRALEKMQESLDAWEAVYGKDHTSCALALVHIAQVHEARGEFDKAQPLLEDALRRHEKTGAKDAEGLISIVDNLAFVSLKQGRWDDADRGYARARQIVVDAEGPDAARVAVYDQALATVQQARGDYAASLPLLTRAREAAVKRSGPKHPTVARYSMLLGDAHRNVGDCKEARAHYVTAQRTRNELELPPDADLVQLLTGIGTCELQAGDRRAAADTLGPAHAMLDEIEVDDEIRAQTRFAVAQLRWATGDKDEARRLAREARGGLEALGASTQRPRQQIEVWLAAHGG